MKKIKLQSLCIPRNTSIKEAMFKLGETAERILLVVDNNGKLLGTLTDGDIRRGLLKGLLFSDKVEEIVQSDCSYVNSHENDLKNTAKKIMIEKKIQQLPVVSNGGEIVDVILSTDLLSDENDEMITVSLPNTVVIMAGGKGSRLEPFTQIFPKPLIPVNGKTVIEHIMDKYHRYGFNRFIYTLNYKKEYLKLFFKEANFPYTIDYVEENNFMGTAGSLSLFKDKINETFFVTNCDSLLDVDYCDVLKWHHEHKAAITIVGCHNEFKIPFGVLQMADGRLEKIVEKPIHDVVINTGIYVIEPRVLSYISNNKPIDMNQLIELVSKEEKVVVYPIHDGWLDIGQWGEYKTALEKLRLIK